MSLYITCSIIADGTQDCSAVPQYDMSTGILETVTLTWGAFLLQVIWFVVYMLTHVRVHVHVHVPIYYNIVHVL